MIRRPPPRVRGRRILLVDDDAEYGRMLRGFAREHGIHVDAVTSSGMEIVWPLVEAYDVVLLSDEYERFTGLQVAEAIGRAIPHKPLVMLATASTPWDRGRDVASIKAVVSKWDGMARLLSTALAVR